MNADEYMLYIVCGLHFGAYHDMFLMVLGQFLVLNRLRYGINQCVEVVYNRLPHWNFHDSGARFATIDDPRPAFDDFNRVWWPSHAAYSNGGQRART